MRPLRAALLVTCALLLTAPALAAPGKSALRGPLASSGKSPVFRFAEVSGSSWYYLWVSNPAGTVFKKWYVAADCSCAAGECSIDPGLNLPDGSYKWWVQTWNGSGYGPWSDAGQFDVDPGAGGSVAGLDLPSGAVQTLHWIDHLAFRAGSEGVAVGFDALDSGVGLGATGLIVSSGPEASPAVIEQGLAVPPGLLIEGVRICLESTSAAAALAEVRIEQLQDPPDATQALLVDAAGFAVNGAACVDTADAPTPIDPSLGGLRLQLGFDLPDPATGAGEAVVIRSVGLHVVSDPDDPIQQAIGALQKALVEHTHEYLTGRGVGHNNTKATTSGPLVVDEE